MKRILGQAEPIIMSVINLTPDSFYAGSRINSISEFNKLVSDMLSSGADIIDIGAMSSRPGALIISEKEELSRIKPYLLELRKEHPETFISIDTVHASVAAFALENGADMINDISAGTLDADLLPMVAKHNAYYCLMHMQNQPETMQIRPKYEDVSLEVLHFLKSKLRKLNELGINKVVVDPGFGFGKTIEDNYQLLKNLNVFKILGHPILVGISRKSMIYKPLHIDATDSLAASSALHLYSLQKGANILRVHDVEEARQVKELFALLGN